MASSSFSLAPAAAISTSSHTSIDHFSLHYFISTAKPAIKAPANLKLCLNHSPFSPFSSPSVINCASTAIDSVELNQEEEIEQAQETQSSDAGRLYVGNLPFTVTSTELTEIFAKAGRVVSAEIVYGKSGDRSRGFAFVTMGSVEEAKEAIKLFDGADIGGRDAKVNFPEVPRGGEKEATSPKIRNNIETPHKIYVGNLNWGVTSQALRDMFGQQPGFRSAKVVFNRETAKSRGFGFVTFSSEEQAKSTLDAMNGKEVGGRPLKLEFAAQNTPSPVQNTPESDLENTPSPVQNTPESNLESATLS